MVGNRAGSLDRFLNPRSVALFGASEHPAKLRGHITRLIVENGYSGTLHFINPARREVAGRPCHASLAEVDGPIDLAIVVVPADEVMAVLESCVLHDVGNALVLSSGFAEEGGPKVDLQRRIASLARRSGMRICGPNSEGFHNEAAHLSATFSPAVRRMPGEVFTAATAQVGVIAQSGGVGFALSHRGRHMGLSFSQVVTTGNEVDLTAADFLAHMVDDPRTACILLFLETIRDGARFMSALTKAAQAQKPIVAIKIGRSAAGGRAAISHTGAMSGSGASYDAMFARYGVSVTDDLGQALAIVAGFVTNPLPAGRRSAVVTVSGGAGALAADRLVAGGLDLPLLGADLQQTIRSFIPAYGATANPVDVTGQATRTGAPLRTITLLCEGDEVDLVVMACTMSNPISPPVDPDQLRALLARRLKPVFFFTYTLPSAFGVRALASAGAVTYTGLDDTVAAITAMLRYRQFLDRRAPGDPRPAQEQLLGLRAGIMSECAAKDLLAAHNIAMAPRILLRDASEAAGVPGWFYPVAAKIQSPDIPHKAEADGIRLGLASADSLKAAYDALVSAAGRFMPEAALHGVLVEKMAAEGFEMIVGVLRDPDFGPVVTVGAGGMAAELLQDVARRLGPVDEQEALEMVRSLRCFNLLDGYRGRLKADVAALGRLVAQVSQFAADYQNDIREIELNPVCVHPAGKGVTVIDALIVIDPKRVPVSDDQAA